jgi:hypothetical protein
LIGITLSYYEVTAMLGEGGMGGVITDFGTARVPNSKLVFRVTPRRIVLSSLEAGEVGRLA